MTKRAKTIKKSHVSRVTVARLYNLGNYEHVRYEITADVPKGVSAKQTLLDTVRIVALLKPLKTPCDYEARLAALKKDPSELTESEKNMRPTWAAEVGEYQRRVAQRMEALVALDDVGGVSVRTDAKDKWDDEPPF